MSVGRGVRTGVVTIVFSAVVVAASGFAAAATSSNQRAPVGVVADCSARSGASFPDAFTSARNLVVGPLAIVGAGETASFDPAAGGNKFPLLVKGGHRVTLELSPATRKVAGLAYGPLPQGQLRLSDAHRVVTFVACPRGAPSGSNADGESVTFWSGGVLATSARCVPLQVWVDSARQPHRAVIHLGSRDCR